MSAIQVTNNYFQDKTAAIAAGLFAPNATPKKVDLYAAIDAHNRQAGSEVKIESLAEQEWYIDGTQWANINKNDTIEEYQEQIESGDYSTERVRITDRITLDPASYDSFTNNLLADYDFLRQLTKCDEEKYLCVAIVTDGDRQILVDPQGFGYARYVGFIPQEKKVEVETIPTNCIELTGELDLEDLPTFDDLLAQWQQRKSKKTAKKAEKIVMEWEQSDIQIAQNLKTETHRHVRAEMVCNLVDRYGVSATAQKTELSATLIGREAHAWRIYSQSEKIKSWYASGSLSWAKINDKLGTNSRKSIAELETIAQGLLKSTAAAA